MEPEVSMPSSHEPTSDPYPEPNESLTSIYAESILILSSYLLLVIPNGFFPSHFPTKILYAFLNSALCATCLPNRFDHSNRIWRSVQVTKLLIMHIFSDYLLLSVS